MIELKNVSYEIDGKKIINNVSITIDSKKMNVIIGPNGAGKSTLLKLIMGIIKPTSGRIYFKGEDITDYEPYRRYSMGLMYCYQVPVRFKGLTVGDILKIVYDDKDTQISVLEAVGLSEDYLDRDLDGSLSGGEIKKIELAMSLLRPEKVALLDEPEAGVDIWSFDKMISNFKNMKSIMVSHNKDLMDSADVLIEMKDGEIYAINER